MPPEISRADVARLASLARIELTDEASARAALRPGIDGVVLRCHGRQGTFLPQMWPRLGDSATFLVELKRKAGFHQRFWSPDIELYRYTVECYTDGKEPPFEE